MRNAAGLGGGGLARKNSLELEARNVERRSRLGIRHRRRRLRGRRGGTSNTTKSSIATRDQLGWRRDDWATRRAQLSGVSWWNFVRWLWRQKVCVATGTPDGSLSLLCNPAGVCGMEGGSGG